MTVTGNPGVRTKGPASCRQRHQTGYPWGKAVRRRAPRGYLPTAVLAPPYTEATAPRRLNRVIEPRVAYWGIGNASLASSSPRPASTRIARLQSSNLVLTELPAG